MLFWRVLTAVGVLFVDISLCSFVRLYCFICVSLKMPAKRKKIVLTISQKLDICKKFESGTPVRILCVDYGVGDSTVRDILKQKDKLKSYASDSDSLSVMERKSMKRPVYEELEKAMAKWISQVRYYDGVAVTGPTIVSKAKEFYDLLGLKGVFHASSGWLTGFKNRHGIKERNLPEETRRDPTTALEEFRADLENLITSEEFSHDQIYYVAESGLLWRCFPSGDGALSQESEDLNKDRLTLITCNNASGDHKLKLTIVSQTESTQSSEDTTARYENINWYHNKRGWMTPKIFRYWFQDHFVPEVREYLRSKGLPLKAVLLLENCPSHIVGNVLRSSDRRISALFMPPRPSGVAGNASGCEGSVIALTKKMYRSNLLQRIICEGQDFDVFWKNYSLLDCIKDVHAAWKSCNPSSIYEPWKKLLPNMEDVKFDLKTEGNGYVADSAKSLSEKTLLNEEEIEKWFVCDLADPGFEYLSDGDIVKFAQEVDRELLQDGVNGKPLVSKI